MFSSNPLNSDDFSKAEQLFTKYNFNPLYGEIRLKLLVLKDSFRNVEELNSLIEETLLIASQEEKPLKINSFFVLFNKVQYDLQKDEELEFNQER
ncbi:hypothetical protein PDJ85_27005 [Bacillus cereus group sp. TH260-2LC]|uniref:hypothetical protein n=1 Tax=Bacillus cereus group TaxID=86661 RepID=UPI0011A25A6C|nr:MULTISPECIES: hypothetical protein [Bacillus cereus group]MDA1531995.1 hypothetical protein [Bacillus cereus group sp. TH260-2LC]